MQIDFYYNTIPEEGDTLQQSVESAASQEARIKDFFEDHPLNEFTPFTVQELLEMECINSVRRSITNLTKRGVLTKTGNHVEGRFGKMNNTWIWNSSNN